MTTPRGNPAPDGERERSGVRHRANQVLAAFLAAIPFAAVLNVFQDWLGNGISASQTGLLIGVLVLLAFLVFATLTMSGDTVDQGRLTRDAVGKLGERMDKSFDEFRDQTGASIRYFPARHGPGAKHLKQAVTLYGKAGDLIDTAQAGDEILAVNSFVEVFHQRSDPAIERLQEEYLRRIENRIGQGAAYHRIIQLPSFRVLNGSSGLLSERIEPSYLEHYRRIIRLKSPDAPAQLVSLDAVIAKYPISFVVVKRKSRGGTLAGDIIWQVNEHILVNGVPQSERFQLSGIAVVKDARGDMVRHFVDWFKELQRGQQRPLTPYDLRSGEDSRRPAA